MKYPLICLFAIAGPVFGADGDTEKFTLKDGRTLIGIYDQYKQTLAMTVPKATIPLAAADIAAREPAKVQEETKKPSPKVAEVGGREAQGSPAYMIPLYRALDDLDAAKKVKEAALAAVDQASGLCESRTTPVFDALNKARFEFFKSINTDPITSYVPQNPTADDLNKAREILDFNELLSRIKADPVTAAHYFDRLNVKNIHDFYHTYARYKGMSWVAYLE